MGDVSRIEWSGEDLYWRTLKDIKRITPDIFEGISQHMPRRIQYMRYRENEGAKVALENRKDEKKPIYLV